MHSAMENYLNPVEVEVRWMHLALAMVASPFAYVLGWLIGWRIMELFG